MPIRIQNDLPAKGILENENEAITTAPGSYFEIGFKGSYCVLNFDISSFVSF